MISNLPVRQSDPQPRQTQHASCPHRVQVATYACPDAGARLHAVPVAPTPQEHMGPWPLAPVAHAALTLLVTAEKEIAGAEVCAAAAGMLDHTDPPSHRLPI